MLLVHKTQLLVSNFLGSCSYQVQLDYAVGGDADDALSVVPGDLETVHPDPELLVRQAYLPDRLADVAEGDTPLVSCGEFAVLVCRIELQAADGYGRASVPG